MNKTKKIFWIGLGLLCVGIGAVGVVLPVLPTTPFLLVASFAFTKGSDRFRMWFLSTKLYKRQVHDIKNQIVHTDSGHGNAFGGYSFDEKLACQNFYSGAHSG